jgi:hypothetical protein
MPDQLIKYCSAVVILLHFCLEAYLNEFLAVKRQMDAQRWDAAISRLDGAGIDTGLCTVGCRTAKNMVRRFHEYAGGVDMSMSTHPLPDPP